MSLHNNIFVCPICKLTLRFGICEKCASDFSKTDSSVLSYICRDMYQSEAEYNHAMRVIDFWGAGWKKRLTEIDHKFLYELNKQKLYERVKNQLNIAHSENSLMSKVKFPMNVNQIALNIGCGAGSEALILAGQGAFCVAMDITSPAAEAAQSLVRKIGEGVGIQADARFIPMSDDSVDIVYSSGVLHHSQNLEKSLSEIFRVLKPGGVAYIMLYATWSLIFM